MISLIAILAIAWGTVLFSIFYFISLQPASLALRIGDRAYTLCGMIRLFAMICEMIVLGGYILFIFGDIYNVVIVKQGVMVIRIAGSVFTIMTLLFMSWGVRDAGKEAALPSKDTRLYKGIYSYMRHPQTLGEMLSWFGIAMILNSLTLLVFSLIWIPLFISFTIIEDNDLAIRFGEDYINYTKQVGLFWRKRKLI
jgi:protein-S-isoprenylcysteine O-methyltransferase Ste14